MNTTLSNDKADLSAARPANTGQGRIAATGDVVCLHLAGGWAVCGPRFWAYLGKGLIRIVEHFANGAIRYQDRHINDCRVLDGTSVLEIIEPNGCR